MSPYKPPGPDNPAIAGPFISRAEAATSIRQADLLILTFLFLIMIGGYPQA